MGWCSKHMNFISLGGQTLMYWQGKDSYFVHFCLVDVLRFCRVALCEAFHDV